jgi:hypothetical protein
MTDGRAGRAPGSGPAVDRSVVALGRHLESALGLTLGLALLAAPAHADEPVPAGEQPATARELAEQNDRLTRGLAKLQEELETLREEHNALKQQTTSLLPLATRVTGYVDFGFFYVGGDGTGIRHDTGYANFPEYQGQVPDSWVFLGDPLATTINSRGDPANTGDSRAVTFNPIRSGDKPTFILNNLNLALYSGLTENLQVNALIDFVPRGRNVSNPDGLFLGDYIDVKLAYVEYTVPIKRFSLTLTAGKFDSVLGYEYRIQESPDRITVTPSLICRYTCGRPLGLKARFKFLANRLSINLALTNGSNAIEQFPIYDETDSNYFKTGSARIGYKLPIGAGLELGASGSLGAQDQQPDNDVLQWHYGFDLHLDVRGVEVQAEFVQGRASGKTSAGGVNCDEAQCLDYKGAYGLIAYRVTNWLMPYVRVDWREALHQNGASFVYVTDLLRVTGGLRFEIGAHVILKAEYTLLRELGRVPEFPDDVLTSSLVIKY